MHKFLIKINNGANNKAIGFIHNNVLKEQLVEISKYFFPVEKIKILESNCLSVVEQLDLYNGVFICIQHQDIKDRFLSIKHKNTDLSEIEAIFKNKKLLPNMRFNYAPLTTMEIERSFSKYGLIFSHLRRSLDSDTIFYMYLLLNDMV